MYTFRAKLYREGTGWIDNEYKQYSIATSNISDFPSYVSIGNVSVSSIDYDENNYLLYIPFLGNATQFRFCLTDDYNDNYIFGVSTTNGSGGFYYNGTYHEIIGSDMIASGNRPIAVINGTIADGTRTGTVNLNTGTCYGRDSLTGQTASDLLALLSMSITNYPITYRPTNCTFPNAPIEATVGDTVVVPVEFPDGYGLANAEDIYVQCNGVVIPSIYENGQLTFTMPDPS